MSPFYKNIALWLVISLMMIMLFQVFKKPQKGSTSISYSDFLTLVENGSVMQVTIQGDNISGISSQGPFKTFAPKDPELIKLLRSKGVKISAKPQESSSWFQVFLSWVPMLLLIGVWIFFMRQMQVGGGKALSFGKSRARLMSDTQERVTFEDVAGVDEAKEELEEIIEFLRDPKKFTKLGGRIPKGVLLVGAPGTGKTLLARAIAGEAGVPFFSISGSDFVEMFVGVGASRVRDLFVQGKKHAPCIIFIDEIDAVGRHRGAGLGGGHDEREQTLNQLLVEMDGFESNEGVILISATNRPDVLDPALLRPGRFDRQVVVPVPDIKGREEILRVHVKKTLLADDVDIPTLARGTPGFTGADLENMVNEAALMAARRGKSAVEMDDFEDAKDKVMMGAERKSMIISDEERRTTAYHESGHTLVAKLLPGTDPIHKVTIIPRGRALGLTQQLPMDEKHTYPKDYLLNNISILMGGRAAEEIVLGTQTTGAGNDIERASEMARKMVCDYGMSENLGPLTFGKKEEQIFLGREIAQHRDYSELTAQKIDEEVRNIVTGAYEKTSQLIKDNIDTLHRMAHALLEKETLDGKAIDEIMKGVGGEAKEVAERGDTKES
ncbi:MAG: ATP-dependent zinc metalloprotease FtsH [Deltaproteobacteria bacterium]|nr:ATP-dependent zinc metalloprotease FtsH [Deltaproteobacteria bacterium]MBW1918973.1 ATP-dependent zinc metalloprotease FtsH [Deltaproteobacteria bacterium]MBW1935020.1 ATP-dependent zinc metalloprotease FtsH [Deltaproteobacteria bacterium]MBW1977064.1 ATP-dependent zinc metalloprotease FtsH [Deltaproteobacteria bacterium]MBW2044271.1 ATP-dependent zinc metalloprotease FtsH [Deltaproteobacteria bacterium]